MVIKDSEGFKTGLLTVNLFWELCSTVSQTTLIRPRNFYIPETHSSTNAAEKEFSRCTCLCVYQLDFA